MDENDQAPSETERMRVANAVYESYDTHLAEKSRTPSRGGNSGALHRHVLIIDGDEYSFFAAHSGKFVYKGETVSFTWKWDPSQKYRNIDRNSVIAWGVDG